MRKLARVHPRQKSVKGEADRGERGAALGFEVRPWQWLSVNTREHQSESSAPVERRVGSPFNDRLNLAPDAAPFGAFAR
jgi:hypothetical protein